MPDHLLVIEENVAVVVSGPEHGAPSKSAGSGIVGGAERGAIDEHARSLYPAPPRDRADKILRPNDLVLIEQTDQGTERGCVVANVVIGQNDLLMRGLFHTGVNSIHLPVGVSEFSIDLFVTADVAENGLVFLKNIGRRAIDDEDFPDFDG